MSLAVCVCSCVHCHLSTARVEFHGLNLDCQDLNLVRESPCERGEQEHRQNADFDA